MNGLDWQVLQLSLGAGLMQRTDDRVRQPPYLDIARDVQFDETGGIQTRYPFTNLLTAGALADARRVVEYHGELLVFTKDGIHAYHEDQDTFAFKATHLAVKATEEQQFIAPGNQWDPDRASLSGMVVHAWGDDDNDIYIACTDETTGTVVVPPTLISDGDRPRLVALSTRILLFWASVGGALNVTSIDPGSDPADIPSDTISNLTQVTAAASFNSRYDVCRVIGADSAAFVHRRDTTTSYTLGIVTSALSVTSATPARDATHSVAIACHPLGTHLQVIRSDGLSVLGDYIAVTGLADVNVDQAIGTVDVQMDQVAAAFRSVPISGSVYRCHAFWVEGSAGTEILRENHVDSNNTLGTAAIQLLQVRLVSRAFNHDGRVFVFVGFFSESTVTGGLVQLQNTLFLYRDDAHLAGKHLAATAGEAWDIDDSPLHNVENIATNRYRMCTAHRRIIPLGRVTGYSDIGPCDVTVEFDSNEARRCVQFGRTLYISGAEILQYDGVNLTEVGFHIYPHAFSAAEQAAGSIATNGTYAVKVTRRWDNAQGERERSTTAVVGEVAIASQPGGIAFSSIASLPITHKTAIATEVWRTKVSPDADAPFYLVTSPDPEDAGDPTNNYLENDPTDASDTFTDVLSDDDIGDLEAHPENGALLPSLPPPAASIILAHDTRLFLAGVAGDPNRVWYSKNRADGEVAAFHPALVVDVPPAGGDITALGMLNETLVVFRETAVYMLPGQGFDNFIGSGQNYGPARTISTDCGAVNHESVAVTDAGLIFKSSKGWYLLTRGWSLEYIGAAIADYDAEEVHAVHVLQGQHQIRVLTDARMLVLDTVAKQWCEWTIDDGIHAVIWRGAHAYLTEEQVVLQRATYTGVTYGIDIETSWIKPADLQGAVRIRWLQVLGEYRSAHDLRYRIAYDYSPTYVDDRTWTVSPTTVGGPEQLRIGPSRQQVQAFKLRLTAQAVGTTAAPSGEALKLTGLGVELGMRRGLHRRFPAEQRK